MLTIHQARVEFGDHVALDRVELTVKPREHLAVLGPSGCGKTTLLRVIAGLQPLDQGRVELRGVDVVDVPPHRRGVGLMFQDGLLFPHMTVADNIAYGLRMRGDGSAARRNRVDELLTMVGLDVRAYADRSVVALSGGEQQRVALARALAPSPDVLLLDEPFGSLDAVLRGRLVDDVRQVTQSLGTTVVAVTHDCAEAFAFADRIAVMDHGRVVQCAAPEELWAAPASRLVAQLVGLSVVSAALLRQAAGEAPTLDPRAQSPVVAVRPTGIRLGAVDGAEESGEARLVGTVESRAPIGDRVRLTVLVEGDGDPDVRRLLVEGPPDVVHARGTRVGVFVQTESIVQLGVRAD